MIIHLEQNHQLIQNETNSSDSHNSSVSMTSHDGLRGCCAIWIMLFHCVIYSKVPINFQGSSIMPLFFLLSGYSLTVSYSKQFKASTDYASYQIQFNSSNLIASHDDAMTIQDIKSDIEATALPIPQIYFSTMNFYRNRLARAYPVYLLCLFYSLPLWFYGYGSLSSTDIPSIVSSIVLSVVPLCTLFMFLLGSCIDGPGWTICTLFVMWLIYPITLKNIQSMTSRQLLDGIVFNYWLQFILVLVLFFITIIFLGFWPAFALSTMNPITRYPLFLMGVYAGEISLRDGRNSSLSSSMLLLFPLSQCCCSGTESTGTVDRRYYWSRRATIQGISLLILTLIVTGLDAFVKFTKSSTGLLGEIWFQAIVPFAQLDLIMALSHDGGESFISKCLQHPILLWLGKRSMCIYLIHYPLIYYLCWMIHGRSLTWPTCSDSSDTCSDQWSQFNEVRTIPLWGIPIVASLTIFLSALVYYFVEEPSRKLLKTSNNRR